jgi:predicted RNase H-like nuclease (RuvC/YqgF family)
MPESKGNDAPASDVADASKQAEEKREAGTRFNRGRPAPAAEARHKSSDGVNTDILDRLEEQVAENGRLTNRIEALELELKLEKTMISELASELQEQRETIEKLQDRLTAARRTNKRHRETQAELERTRNMLMTLQAEVDYAMAQVAAAEQASTLGRGPRWRLRLRRERSE